MFDHSFPRGFWCYLSGESDYFDQEGKEQKRTSWYKRPNPEGQIDKKTFLQKLPIDQKKCIPIMQQIFG